MRKGAPQQFECVDQCFSTGSRPKLPETKQTEIA